MIARDPTHQILKAYYNLLNDSIVYNGAVIPVGTRIPDDETEYIYLYVESLIPESTDDNVIYKAVVTMQIVSLQDVSEGDETVIHSIFDQLLERVGDADALIMTDFNCVMAQFEDGNQDPPEMDDTNYISTRKLRMLNFLEQIK